MQAVVGDREFPVVTDSNKKDGRRAAAEAALRVLAEEGRYGVKLEKQKVQEPTNNQQTIAVALAVRNTLSLSFVHVIER